MFRHGDVFLAPAKTLPRKAKLLPHCILAEGEKTGHKHRIQEHGVAELYEHGDERFLRVTAESATLVHPEHADIPLTKGLYRVWFQREYTPRSIRRILD
ncbi:MAG: hypothetical protein KDB14_03925 [Planctomycetales bacterium]|nr:hypothetical protein [Planctomycetales bacterium]